MKGFVKDPNATLDYSFDWGPWLDTDTIDTSVWVVESPLVPTNETNDTTTTRVFLSGGTHGNKYLVTNRITTTGGLIDDRSFEIIVRNR